MRQWEIYDFPYPSPAQAHPFVILSIDEIADNPAYEMVNALMCVTVRGDYQPKRNDVRLDESDGLDWRTVVRCHFMHTLDKASFRARRGSVTLERRRNIARKINDCFKLAGL